MKTSEVLNKAADALERDGWQQGGLGSPGGPRCAMGAMRTVVGEQSMLSFLTSFLTSAPYRVLRDHVGDYISDWNDEDGRTADEVIATLRAAAVIAASRETEPTTQPSGEGVAHV